MASTEVTIWNKIRDRIVANKASAGLTGCRVGWSGEGELPYCRIIPGKQAKPDMDSNGVIDVDQPITLRFYGHDDQVMTAVDYFRTLWLNTAGTAFTELQALGVYDIHPVEGYCPDDGPEEPDQYGDLHFMLRYRGSY